jgi:hypothetical protein
VTKGGGAGGDGDQHLRLDGLVLEAGLDGRLDLGGGQPGDLDLADIGDADRAVAGDGLRRQADALGASCGAGVAGEEAAGSGLVDGDDHRVAGADPEVGGSTGPERAGSAAGEAVEVGGVDGGQTVGGGGVEGHHVEGGVGGFGLAADGGSGRAGGGKAGGQARQDQRADQGSAKRRGPGPAAPG